MAERCAAGGVYISKTRLGLGAEIGEWAEGTTEYGSFVGCTDQNLLIALRWLIIQKRISQSQATAAEVDAPGIQVQTQRIRTALDRVKVINRKVTDVRATATDIQLEAEALRDEVRNSLTHAKRQGWIEFNPIETVRQSAHRERVPDVLEPFEARAICEALDVRELVLAILGLGDGPRVSESLALKWGDVAWSDKQLFIRRSIYHQRINENCKTANSKKAVPLDDRQIAALLEWRRVTPYNSR